MTRAVTAAQKVPGVKEARLVEGLRLVVTYETQQTNLAEIARIIQLTSSYEAVPVP